MGIDMGALGSGTLELAEPQQGNVGVFVDGDWPRVVFGGIQELESLFEVSLDAQLGYS